MLREGKYKARECTFIAALNAAFCAHEEVHVAAFKTTRSVHSHVLCLPLLDMLLCLFLDATSTLQPAQSVSMVMFCSGMDPIRSLLVLAMTMYMQNDASSLPDSFSNAMLLCCCFTHVQNYCIFHVLACCTAQQLLYGWCMSRLLTCLCRCPCLLMGLCREPTSRPCLSFMLGQL